MHSSGGPERRRARCVQPPYLQILCRLARASDAGDRGRVLAPPIKSLGLREFWPYRRDLARSRQRSERASRRRLGWFLDPALCLGGQFAQFLVVAAHTVKGPLATEGREQASASSRRAPSSRARLMLCWSLERRSREPRYSPLGERCFYRVETSNHNAYEWRVPKFIVVLRGACL